MSRQSKRGSRQGRRGYGPSGFEEAGGYMSAKIAKLENQYQTSLTTSNHEKQRGIFSGVAIFVNGYTEPTAEELKRIMMVNGGIYHHYYSRSKTTHIIANNLPNTKVKNMNTDNIVSPKWITDSLQAGHLLDYSKYILYNNQSLSQPKLGFKPLESSRKETVMNPPVMDKSLGKEEDSNSGPSQDSEDTPSLSSSDQSRSSVSSATLCKTPVEHNAIESGKLSLKSPRTDVGLSPSKVHSMNTSNPGFLSEFYNNSRLHHISTMGAVFKQYVTEMQMKNTDFAGRQKLMDWAKSKSPLSESSKMPLKTTSRKMKRMVMHIDMDCFFVSVGLRKHPELRGKPIAVTHARANVRPEARKGMDRQYELNYYRERANKRLQSAAMKVGKSHSLGSIEDDVDFQDDENGELTSDSRNTGTLPVTDKFSSIPLIDDNSSMSEIASCSYEAREAGVKNGMFLGAALKLCPHLQTIPYDFEGYKEVSYKLYDIVADFTHDIEAVSCDEMFVDLTDVLRSCQVTPHEFASYLREQVQNATGCPCSAGMGPNMLVARMATRIAKPNGQHMAEPEDLALYMKDQKVTGLPGVGWSLSKRLESEGIITCDDLQRKSLGHLQSVFGTKTGQSLYNYCRGIDERPVKSEHQRKSVSAEVNYGIRFTCKADAEKFLNELSSEVENRLNSVSLKGKCITLKLKIRAKDAPVETAKFMGHGVCDNIAKSVTLGVATSSASVIEREAVSLLKQVKAPPQDLRGVGIQVSRLEGHLGPSGSSSSGSCSIKSFLLSAKTSSKKPSHSDHDSRKVVGEESHSDKTGQLSKIFEGKETESIGRSPAFQEIAEEPQPGPSRVADPQGDPSGIPFQRDKQTSVKDTIDVEVLMALPAELREQVMLEYQQQGYKMPHVGDIEMSPQPSTSRCKDRDMKMQKNKGDRKMVKPSDVSTDIPITSRTEEIYNMDRNTRDNRSNSAAESSRRNEDEEDMHITSFSQVDSSFLDAIPADLREELRKDFEYKKNTAAAGVNTHSSSNQSKNLVPQQNRRSSPQKHSKSSGGGQSKRGRLSKTSKRRAVNEGLTKLTSLMSAQQLPKTVSPSKRMDMFTPSSVDDDQRKAGQTASKEPANSSKADPSSPASDSGSGSSSRESSGSCKQEEDRETVPNLCGVEELVNVKALIREWVSSCPQPELEDADILASYYTSLILHHDLERLDILIRFLHRQVLRTDNKHWVSAYKSVIGRVQSVMLENYQAKLKVKIL